MQIYWKPNNSRSWHVQLRPRTQAKRRFLTLAGLVAVCLLAVVCIKHWWSGQKHAQHLVTHVDAALQADVPQKVGSAVHPDSPETIAQEQTPEPEPSVIRGRIRSGESLAAALGRWGVSATEVHYLARALRKEVNPRTIRPGDLFALWPHEKKGCIASFELVRATHMYDAPVHYRLQRQENVECPAFSMDRLQMPVTTQRVGLSGQVTLAHPNLYGSILAAGGDAALVDQLSVGVFGWQINFHRDVRPGDRFKIITEKRFAKRPCLGENNSWDLCESSMGYGAISAAEYINFGKIYRGFLYKSPDGKVEGFFDENGISLEKTFLKSPMKLTRITSRFSVGKKLRFHPVRKKRVPHNGVDFGASTGTPFWSVADGVVVRMGFRHPANGNFVVIQHPGGVQTLYLHASRLPKHIRPGVRVKQREIIGYVGATGWATASHLHFGMKRVGRNGYRYVNPLKQKFPAGKSVPVAYREDYKQHITPLLLQLAQIGTDTNARPLPAVQAASFSRERDMVAGEGLEPPTSGL